MSSEGVEKKLNLGKLLLRRVFEAVSELRFFVELGHRGFEAGPNA